MNSHLGGIVCETDDFRCDHFIVQIVSFTSSLPYSSKYGVTSMSFGDVVNQFHNQHSFTYTSSTKQSCSEIDQYILSYYSGAFQSYIV